MEVEQLRQGAEIRRGQAAACGVFHGVYGPGKGRKVRQNSLNFREIVGFALFQGLWQDGGCRVYDPSGHQLLHGPGDAAVLPAQLFSAEERGDLAAVAQDSLMQRCRVGGQLFGKHGAPLLPCWFFV